MKSLRRLMAIMRKEVRQLLRDRLTFGMIVGIPLIQFTLFGYAINTDTRHLGAAVADQANTHLSRQVVMDISASQVVNFEYRVATPQQLRQLLDQGVVSVGLFIPYNFDKRVIKGNRKAAHLFVDGTDPIILGVAQQLTSIPIKFDTQESNQQTNNLIEVRNFYNPERRSALNIVPGLIGVILSMTMVLFTAVALVRERERGNLELLINTPVKTAELMVGKILPYIVIGLIQMLIILLLGWFLFQVRIEGLLINVFIVALIFIAANLSLGLLISTLVETQFQAMQLTMFFYLPSILLSGFMFPFDGMPKAAQYFAEILPLTHFMRLIRGIVLRGSESAILTADSFAIIVFMVITLSLAILRFRKRLD